MSAELIQAARVEDKATLDDHFSCGNGFNATVHTVLVQSDGKIVVGGEFTSFHGRADGRTSVKRFRTLKIARLLADGSLDTTFCALSGFNSTVYALAQEPDGSLLVGGNFTSFLNNASSITPVGKIARLTPEGRLDSTFHTGAGFDHRVYSLARDPQGNILAGGYFSRFETVSGDVVADLSGIARLSPEGSVDEAFSQKMRVNNSVSAITVQPDGRILIAGSFTEINGPRQHLPLWSRFQSESQCGGIAIRRIGDRGRCFHSVRWLHASGGLSALDIRRTAGRTAISYSAF